MEWGETIIVSLYGAYSKLTNGTMIAIRPAPWLSHI